MSGRTAAEIRLCAPDGIAEVNAGEDLASLVCAAAERSGWAWLEGDVVVLAQKIVSKAEGQLVRLDTVAVSEEAQALATKTGKDPRLVALVLAETVEVLRAVKDVLIVRTRHGLVLANAGIDRSNVPQDGGGEQVLLPPVDPDASARRIRDGIAQRCGIRIGVVINDSLGRAWREGAIGTAIGLAGLPAVDDRRGQHDREGRKLQVTQVGLADEIAAAASLLMGQGAEGRPLVFLRGLAFPQSESAATDLVRPLERDLFR